jgi:hypothetical protein
MDVSPPSDATGDLQVLTLAEALIAAMGDAFDADALDALRTVAEGYSGAPDSAAGAVTASLSDLISALIKAGRGDREALAVHVRAWRLMLTDAPGPAGEAALLAGLAAVRGLYATPKAA